MYIAKLLTVCVYLSFNWNYLILFRAGLDPIKRREKRKDRRRERERLPGSLSSGAFHHQCVCVCVCPGPAAAAAANSAKRGRGGGGEGKENAINT